MSYRAATRLGLALCSAIFVAAAPSSTRAETVSHVVGRGHTLEAIANRYHVTVKSIVAANHIKDAKHLRVGENLTIPGATVSTTQAASHAAAAGASRATAATAKGKAATTRPITYAARARTPGVIHATRLATTEDISFRIQDRRGHVSPNALKSAERLLRFPNGQTHPIDPRLLSLLAVVSDHFGSRKIEVISGFRPYTPTQYTPHSNHNVGKAIDFRVAGVPNEVLRDFCRTLRNVGCGYYPNSTFVHMDVRPTSAFWIDYSKPGEPPRYNAPGVDADEGTSDVADDAHPPPAGDAKPDNDAPSTAVANPAPTTTPNTPPTAVPNAAPPAGTSQGAVPGL